MRRNPTEWEMRLWRHLSNRQLGGFTFRRQAVIGSRIVDFFCPSIALIVEVDGDTHDQKFDRRRDAVALNQGFATVRITNLDIAENMAGVLSHILSVARSIGPRTAWRLPHPNPSPEVEGLK